MLKMLLMQLQFLTRIPVPVNIKFEEKTFARSMMLSPLAGLLIGIILGCVYYFAHMTDKQMFAAVMVVAAEIVLTGGLHLDGLADTSDGIFSNRPKDKILEIMKDSRIGTNGTISLILVILIKTTLLSSIDSPQLFYYLFAFPVVSRMNILWASGISDYAAKDGMGKAIVKYTGIKEVAVATVLTCIITGIFLRWAAIIVIPAAILFVFIFCTYVRHKIGGVTGDILGAVIELTEIVVLFILFLWG